MAVGARVNVKGTQAATIFAVACPTRKHSVRGAPLKDSGELAMGETLLHKLNPFMTASGRPRKYPPPGPAGLG